MKSAYVVIAEAALALRPAELIPCFIEAKLAQNNALLAIDEVGKHRATLKARYKKFVDPSAYLTTLFEVLIETNEAVNAARPTPGEAKNKAIAVYDDRDVLMSQLISFGKTGLVDAATLERIQAGHGPIDAAEDVLAIAKLVASNEPMRAKLITTPEQLQQMVTRATEYLRVAHPAEYHVKRNDELTAALEQQSRVWTLITRQYDLLWKLGAELFGRDVDEYVRPLGSRVVARKLKATDPTPEPAPVS